MGRRDVLRAELARVLGASGLALADAVGDYVDEVAGSPSPPPVRAKRLDPVAVGERDLAAARAGLRATVGELAAPKRGRR